MSKDEDTHKPLPQQLHAPKLDTLTMQVPDTILTRKHPFFESFDRREFACGCGAAFINIAVTYPIYKMIFRQMLHNVAFTSAFDQLRHEGMIYLYRGMFPPMAQKTISLSLMFGVYDGTRRFLLKNVHANEYMAKIVAGIAAGTVEAVFSPFERIQTLLAHSKYHQDFRNTPTAIRYVVVNHGFWELYRGILPVLLRNGPSNAMFFVLREEAIRLLPQRTKLSTRAAQEFLAGAFIGATVSTVFYPLNVIKVHMQSNMGHSYETLWAATLRIYRERNSLIHCFYRGCAFNACRSFMSWGIMNVAYESLKKLLT